MGAGVTKHQPGILALELFAILSTFCTSPKSLMFVTDMRQHWLLKIMVLSERVNLGSEKLMMAPVSPCLFLVFSCPKAVKLKSDFFFFFFYFLKFFFFFFF